MTSVLTSLAQRHHSIESSKMYILRLIIEYLGHMPTPDGTMPTSKHVEAVINMSPPLGGDGLADVRLIASECKYIFAMFRSELLFDRLDESGDCLRIRSALFSIT